MAHKSTHGLKMVKVRAPDGKMHIVPEGTDPNSLIRPGQKYVYNDDIGAKILSLYLAGHSLAEIARMPGMPKYDTIMYWLKVKRHFACNLKETRKLRAIYHEEKALEEANAADEDNVQAQRLKVETHKWAASVTDADTYGKGKGIEAQGNVQIIINTGVPLPDPPKEVKAEEVTEEADDS
jgi:hypothetical protein